MLRRLRRSVSLVRKNGLRGFFRELQDFVGYACWSATRTVLRRTTDPRPLLWSGIRLRNRLSGDEYTDADPFKILRVDPSDVDRFDDDVPKRWGRVIGGRWDRHDGDFVEKTTYRSVVARYRDGVPWEETAKYQQYREKLEDHQTVKGFDSVEELEAYYAEIDDLYDRIAAEGYKTQEKLLREQPSVAFDRNNDAMHPLLNEVRVSIGRDGEFHKKGAGNHRLTIARLLELEAIPVLVSTRHAKWQAIRDEVAATETYDELSDDARGHLTHPDLRDVTPLMWQERAAESDPQ